MEGAHLSIFSDASYNCQTKQAAYAFVVELHGKTARYANSYTYNVHSSKDAELLGLGHALNFLIHEHRLTHVDSMQIFIDNVKAIREINKQSTRQGFLVWMTWQRLIAKTGSKKNIIGHVKAHSSRVGMIYEMNDWCDIHARIELRKLVNAARGVQEQVGRITERHKGLPIQVTEEMEGRLDR